MQRRYTHYVCPQNGEPTRCPFEDYKFPHRVEMLLAEGRKAPVCETHQVKLVALK